MKHFIAMTCLACAFLLETASVHGAEEKKLTCYELRTYHAAEGKLDALNARFREHTVALFARHGMTSVGYWMPIENPGHELIYLLAYPDRAAREVSWKEFQADPEWIAAKAASEKDGTLVDKVDSVFLTPTDFSPRIDPSPQGGSLTFEMRTYTATDFRDVSIPARSHTFEMRTYTATPGNLPRLLDRFRQHTLALFLKHGMANVAYFTLAEGQPGAENTLLYFLAHASPQAHDASFAAFGADPDWQKAKAASEAAAGGSLTVPDGVKSRLMASTDYSPIR